MLCRKCGGSGKRLITGSPYKLKKCSNCNGWGTKGRGKFGPAKIGHKYTK